MNFRKIAAIGAAFVMAAGIVTGVPMSTENNSPFAIAAEAADSKLAAPKNLKAAAGSGKVTLTWTKVKGADAYCVYKYNDKTKKYEQCKIVESEKAIITGLKNGTAYKFKVAAGKEKDESFEFGSASTAVSVTPKTAGKTSDNSNTKNEKPKMKEVQLSASEMTGMWVYYDFLSEKRYTTGTSYDPNKLQANFDGWVTNILILDKATAVIGYDDSEYGKFTNIANIKNNAFIDAGCLQKYKVYSYGEDKFLFVQFINDSERTYIFKYASEYASVKRTQVTDITKLEGRWTATDFCYFDLSYRDGYNPLYPLWNNLYVTGAVVTDGKITISTTGDYWAMNEKIGKDKIGDSKYYVYDINGTLYMYYQFINGDGDKQFYVLKKK